MKTRIRKLVALLLAGTMAIATLAGCGDSGNGDSQGAQENEGNQKEEGAPEKDGEQETGDEGEAAADGDVTELDIFINMSWWPIDTFTGIIPEEIEAKTGVKLNLTIAADGQQLGLMIAGNELPDLVFTDQELDRLSNSELCYSYDELIEQYAPEFKPDELRTNIARSFSSDENFYTILNCMSTNEEWENAPAGAPGQACIYYRKDLYEAMGSPKLETLDDFLAVCGQVKKEYPDMVPFGLGAFWKLHNISAWLGAAGGGGGTYQMLDDGSVVLGVSSPKYKEYLQYANTLAREGYITAEAYANENESDGQQAAFNGDCFFYPWYLSPSSLQTMNTESQKINPDAKWAVLRPLGQANYNTSKGWAGLFVSKSCKDPEKAIKFIEYMFSDEGRHLQKWGREGIEYTLDENGMPVFSDEWNAARSNPDEMNKKYNQYFYFGVNGVEELLGDYVGMDEEDLADCTAYKEGYKNYPEIGIAVPTSNSDEGIIEAKLKEMLDAEEAKVIFSADDAEFEKNFENLMENAEKIGVDQLNSYMTERVKEIKEQFHL